jgi:hypothetical protein
MTTASAPVGGRCESLVTANAHCIDRITYNLFVNATQSQSSIAAANGQLELLANLGKSIRLWEIHPPFFRSLLTTFFCL